MIYFDRDNVKVLRYIRSRKNGVSIGFLEKKFGEAANINFLINLCRQDYILFKDGKDWAVIDYNTAISNSYLVFPTSKANEFIEKRCFEFWRWVIPTIISVVALTMNIFSLLLR